MKSYIVNLSPAKLCLTGPLPSSVYHSSIVSPSYRSHSDQRDKTRGKQRQNPKESLSGHKCIKKFVFSRNNIFHIIINLAIIIIIIAIIISSWIIICGNTRRAHEIIWITPILTSDWHWNMVLNISGLEEEWKVLFLLIEIGFITIITCKWVCSVSLNFLYSFINII